MDIYKSSGQMINLTEQRQIPWQWSQVFQSHTIYCTGLHPTQDKCIRIPYPASLSFEWQVVFQKVGQIGNAQVQDKDIISMTLGHHDHDLTWPTAVGKPYKCVICVFISLSLPLTKKRLVFTNKVITAKFMMIPLWRPNPMSINSCHETPTKNKSSSVQSNPQRRVFVEWLMAFKAIHHARLNTWAVIKTLVTSIILVGL